jgi:hypothetical protein
VGQAWPTPQLGQGDAADIARTRRLAREPAGAAAREQTARRPNPASLVTPVTLVQYSGGDDPHEKTALETVGFRQPVETARRGGPDERRS